MYLLLYIYLYIYWAQGPRALTGKTPPPKKIRCIYGSKYYIYGVKYHIFDQK